MDKETYLRLKRERQEEAHKQKHAKESFCFKCHRLQKHCLCFLISPFDTNIKFVILMHPMEAKKEKMGTGRIVLATLLNSQMIMGVDFTEDETVNSLIKDPRNYCMVMYPGEKSINISDHDVTPLVEIQKKQKQIIVFLIDGTWPCAKKMMMLSQNVKNLPRISFSALHTSIFEIKEQPADYCLSTLESIHFFIKECNRRGLESTMSVEDQLIVTFKAMIDFQIKCSVDPSLSHYGRGGRGYSKKEDRVRAKKWLTRNIVLPD